ncbi:MAG: hypothetical protein ACOCQD_03915 [archaeon]
MNNNDNLKPGDIIITDKGKMYPDYLSMARKLGLYNFEKGEMPIYGHKGRVVAMESHEFHPSQICVGIKLYNGKEIIMGMEGISIVKRKNAINLDDELFELE